MTGNASEWAADWFTGPINDDYAINPEGAENGLYKYILGGNVEKNLMVNCLELLNCGQ